MAVSFTYQQVYFKLHRNEGNKKEIRRESYTDFDEHIWIEERTKRG